MRVRGRAQQPVDLGPLTIERVEDTRQRARGGQGRGRCGDQLPRGNFYRKYRKANMICDFQD